MEVLILFIFLGGLTVILFSLIKKKSTETIKKYPVQTRVIEYFMHNAIIGGRNYAGSMKYDADYDELVKSQISINDVKTRAFVKLGLDESELTEIEPIHFENYYFGSEDDIDEYVKYSITSSWNRPEQMRNSNVMIGIGKDGKLRSSVYQVTWLFSTPKQVCVYQEIIYLHKNETDEITRQFLWKHITSMTGLRNTLKIKSQSGQISEKVDVFQLSVAGDSFICSMTPTDYTTKAINAMKQRLLEFS